MSSIYFFSGPCGCGKSTLANAFARFLVDKGASRQVYVIHGDDFHAGFVETQERIGPACETFFYWPDILRFNWECMISVAEKVLTKGVDVVFDYVIEDELPLVQALASRYHADLHYVVLTAEENAIRQRLTKRGDPGLIERALFLKNKLDNMPENQGHLYDNTGKSLEQELAEIQMEHFRIKDSCEVRE